MNRKEIVILSLITFLTVIFWITFGIRSAQKSPTVSKTQLQQTVPLTPTFDTDTIKLLYKREE